MVEHTCTDGIPPDDRAAPGCLDSVPSDDRTASDYTESASIKLLRGLLQLYTAQDSSTLADALASLVASSVGATSACVFLDDGSGLLAPLIGEREPLPGLSDVRLSAVQPGPVADVLRRGEVVVSDNPEDIIGENAPALPARRVLLCRLAWQEETLGVVLFCDQGHEADLELCLELARHVSLALIRLRALKRTYRFGGIDPTRWTFDREWLNLRLEEEVERAKRYGRPLALLLFSFGNLEELAERGGQQQKDVFLRRVAAVIRGQIRSPDILAGYGEAAIAVLLPETERAAAIATQARIASRILQLRPTTGDITDWTPGLLIGAASHPDDGDSAASLITAAESSLAPSEGEERLQKTA